MKQIGYYEAHQPNRESGWISYNAKNVPSHATPLYICSFYRELEVDESDKWVCVGYVFPNDDGGRVFPSGQTGGINSVAAYVKRAIEPKPDPRDVTIAQLQKALEEANEQYLDRAAFAALTGLAIVVGEPETTECEAVAMIAYSLAGAMLVERQRRQKKETPS